VIAILLAFNPTLALNSISIGYEVPIVSMSLISLAALIRFFRTQKRRVFTGEIFVASISYAIASFMQPRLLLIAAAFFFTWSLARFRLLLISPFLITTIAIVSLAPGLLIFRNEKAQGFSAISTNLGATMRLGAGPGTSGGYSSQASGTVECPEVKGNAAQVDRAIVKCVLSWYVNNPGHAIRLFFNKARFFWSPWYGPEANGTMARNPWNQIHPLKPFTQTESGFELQFGTLGKFVSWLWMLSSLALLALGTLHLWRLGDLERLLGVISVMTFLLSLLTSMLTIGDHRFRLPCMGLILFLQAVGFARLFNKSQRFPVSTSPLVSWPSIRR
jgi:hypothetical protein